MRQQHSTAAISFQAKYVECITFGVFTAQEFDVGFPFVTDHFAAGETTNGDDHCYAFTRSQGERDLQQRASVEVDANVQMVKRERKDIAIANE